MFDPILVTLLTMQSSCENEPYPGAHPHKPVTRKYPLTPGKGLDIENNNSAF